MAKRTLKIGLILTVIVPLISFALLAWNRKEIVSYALVSLSKRASITIDSYEISEATQSFVVIKNFSACLEAPVKSCLKADSLRVEFGLFPLNANVTTTSPTLYIPKLELSASAPELSVVWNAKNKSLLGSVGKLDVKYKDSTLSDAQIVANCTIQGCSSISLTAKKLAGPIALTDLKAAGVAKLPGENPFCITIPKSTANIFGGVITMSGIDTCASPGKAAILSAKAISLKLLTAAFAKEVVVAEGTVDASLPITFTPEIIIVNGTLKSRTPGGNIRYLGDGGGLPEVAVAALRNYQFSSLEGELSYRSSVVHLNTHLKGSWEIMNKLQPVNVNLALEDNLKSLLENMSLKHTFDEVQRSGDKLW